MAPGWDPEVAQRSARLGLPHLPGVATASEILDAGKAGHGWMKAFPADAMGARWFAGMRGPFPGIGFVATGGIHADNAHGYLESGDSAIGVGSSFEKMTSAELEMLVRWHE